MDMREALTLIILVVTSTFVLPGQCQIHVYTSNPCAVIDGVPTIFTWSGGKPPFNLSIISTDFPVIVPLQPYDQTGSSFIWTPDICPACSIILTVTDSTGAVGLSGEITIKANANDDGCDGRPVQSSSIHTLIIMISVITGISIIGAVVVFIHRSRGYFAGANDTIMDSPVMNDVSGNQTNLAFRWSQNSWTMFNIFTSPGRSNSTNERGNISGHDPGS